MRIIQRDRQRNR